jgi:Ni,Fe-hydrogenase I small subunit
VSLAKDPWCVAVIAIGQCATFGGYPGCKPQVNAKTAGGFDPTKSQTDALGTYAYLSTRASATVANKVFNVPGCPTNPWWFVLSVVLFLVDVPGLIYAAPGTVGTLGTLRKYQSTVPTAPFYASVAENALGIGPNGSAAVDGNRRLKAVYGVPVHSSACPRFPWYAKGIFAAKPGDPGCLQRIGCKGMATSSLCGVHGWNAQQVQNNVSWAKGLSQINANVQPDGTTLKGFKGGHCTRAGHPCMACTEAGYPDNFVPFIVRS